MPVADEAHTDTTTVTHTEPGGHWTPESTAVNDVTNRIYVANGDSILVFDGTTNIPLSSIQSPPNGWIYNLAVNSQTNRVYAPLGNLRREIAVFDGRTNKLIADISIPLGRVLALVVNPTTNRVYAIGDCLKPGSGGCSDQDTFVVVDGETNVVSAAFHFSDNSSALAVNPASNRVYVGIGREIAVLDGRTNLPVASIPVPYPEAIAVDPQTNRIFAVHSDADLLLVADGGSNSLVATIPLDCYPGQVEVNSGTGRVYVSATRFGATQVMVVDGISESAGRWSGNCRDLDGKTCECKRNSSAASPLTPTSTVAE